MKTAKQDTVSQMIYYLSFVLYSSVAVNMLACYLLCNSTIQTSWFNGKGLKLACLNINRLMGKIDQVKLCLDDQKPALFGLSETFLTSEVSDRLIQHI